MNNFEERREIRLLAIACFGTLIAMLALIFAVYTFIRSSYSFDYRAINATNIPDYSTQSEVRRDILKVVEQEIKKPVDSTKYSDGNQEPWCADFVSWIYMSSGHPFSNPNSGSWRISGTHTLQEYFKQEGRWFSYGTSLPQPGDVIIYRHGIFGDHANIVVSTNYDEILTIGGNENGRIMMHKIKYSDKRYGILGYGAAPESDAD